MFEKETDVLTRKVDLTGRKPPKYTGVADEFFDDFPNLSHSPTQINSEQFWTFIDQLRVFSLVVADLREEIFHSTDGRMVKGTLVHPDRRLTTRLSSKRFIFKMRCHDCPILIGVLVNIQHSLDEWTRPTQIERIDERLAEFPMPLCIGKFNHNKTMKNFL